MVVMQNDGLNISSSSHGMPLSCVCTPNPLTGLGVCRSGTSTIGCTPGLSAVYTVPGKIKQRNHLTKILLFFLV